MNTRHFTVKGNINCLFAPDNIVSVEEIEGIEVQLWQDKPPQAVYLGNALTDATGQFLVEFSVESPVENIDDGQIKNVFIKAYYNGTLLTPAEFDLDASAYFERLTPQPSNIYKEAVNTLVKQLKSSSNWAKLDRLWIHATEYQQHAGISLVHPSSVALTEVGAISWSQSSGYEGNGSSTYINSHFNPAEDGEKYTQDSASLFAYSLSDTDGFKVDMGSLETLTLSVNCAVLNINDGGYFYPDINNDGFTTTIANGASKGFFLAERVDASTQRVYKNGVQLEADVSNSSVTPPNYNFYILASNADGDPAHFSDRQLAITGIGSGEIDQPAFYSAIQEFATTIGFNV